MRRPSSFAHLTADLQASALQLFADAHAEDGFIYVVQPLKGVTGRLRPAADSPPPPTITPRPPSKPRPAQRWWIDPAVFWVGAGYLYALDDGRAVVDDFGDLVRVPMQMRGDVSEYLIEMHERADLREVLEQLTGFNGFDGL
jgi:hypothetical protein